MYRWIVISIIVLSSFVTTFFQIEMWPFSPYLMFSSNLSNTALNGLQSYELVGLRSGDPAKPIESRLVTGFIHPGMVSVSVAKLVAAGNPSCVQSLLNYWGARYSKLRASVPAELRNFESLRVRKRGSVEHESDFKFDIQSHESN